MLYDILPVFIQKIDAQNGSELKQFLQVIEEIFYKEIKYIILNKDKFFSLDFYNSDPYLDFLAYIFGIKVYGEKDNIPGYRKHWRNIDKKEFIRNCYFLDSWRGGEASITKKLDFFIKKNFSDCIGKFKIVFFQPYKNVLDCVFFRMNENLRQNLLEFNFSEFSTLGISDYYENKDFFNGVKNFTTIDKTFFLPQIFFNLEYEFHGEEKKEKSKNYLLYEEDEELEENYNFPFVLSKSFLYHSNYLVFLFFLSGFNRLKLKEFSEFTYVFLYKETVSFIDFLVFFCLPITSNPEEIEIFYQNETGEKLILKLDPQYRYIFQRKRIYICSVIFLKDKLFDFIEKIVLTYSNRASIDFIMNLKLPINSIIMLYHEI